MALIQSSIRTVSGVKAWQAATVDPSSRWYYPLPQNALAALRPSAEKHRKEKLPWEQLRPTEEQKSLAASTVREVKAALEEGRGFAIIPLPCDDFFREDLTAIYWLVGQMLGVPFQQNVQGTILYDVKDMGQDLSKGARFSVTNYESSFHTDNSFGSDVLDYVGLLCLAVAKSGGLSQVISGYAVYDELAKNHPEDLEILSQPFHVDQRGGVLPGEKATAFYPVMKWDGDELLFRYLRHWIEAGHEKAGHPLSDAQVRALNRLDQVLKDRKLVAEFALKPGDIYFINNRWILHNRTAFEDHAEAGRRRHLVRLWLKAGGA